jgi:hypothetical protein
MVLDQPVPLPSSATQGAPRPFWIRDYLIFLHGARVYLPGREGDANLLQEILGRLLSHCG